MSLVRKEIKKSCSIDIKRQARYLIHAGVHVNALLKGVNVILFSLRRGSSLQLVNVVKGNGVFEQVVGVELSGSGARAEVLAGFHGTGKARHSLDITMHHKAVNTKGDILVRGVYEDESRGIFTGTIKIDPQAQQSQSFFTDNILLLDSAEATSVPMLEIMADDIRASHGSTTSGIEEEQLFYLTSRGISVSEARNMIISGFLQPITQRLQSL